MSAKPRKRRGKKRQKGEGPVLDWIKKAARSIHTFVKDNKLISRGASTLAPFAGPYAGTVSRVGTVANTMGYGKKRRKPGRPRKRNVK